MNKIILKVLTQVMSKYSNRPSASIYMEIQREIDNKDKSTLILLDAMRTYATEAINKDRLRIKDLAKINHSQDEFGNNAYELDTSLIDIEPINLP